MERKRRKRRKKSEVCACVSSEVKTEVCVRVGAFFYVECFFTTRGKARVRGRSRDTQANVWKCWCVPSIFKLGASRHGAELVF